MELSLREQRLACPPGRFPVSRFSSALVQQPLRLVVYRYDQESGGLCIRPASHPPVLARLGLARDCRRPVRRGPELVQARPRGDRDNATFHEE